jgi:hypothetical protein
MTSPNAPGRSLSSRRGRPPYVPVRGTHIFVDRGTYSHHGIDRGDGAVADFSGAGGKGGKAAGIIQVVTVEQFAGGDAIQVQRYGRCDSPNTVIARAESKLGESGYHLFENNCEHFATWCMTAAHESAQVHVVGSVAANVVAWQLGPRLAKDIVASLGRATPASAANTMSGLKTLGGSPAGGVAVLATAGAVLGNAAVIHALRDKPYLPAEERDARRIGRGVGMGAGGVAAVGVMHAVGSLGIAGYGAAGMSSGLAALGSVAGGGMVAGLAVAVTVPAVAAWLLGLFGAWLAQWWAENRVDPKLSF